MAFDGDTRRVVGQRWFAEYRDGKVRVMSGAMMSREDAEGWLYAKGLAAAQHGEVYLGDWLGGEDPGHPARRRNLFRE